MRRLVQVLATTWAPLAEIAARRKLRRFANSCAEADED
jgi:hypothetical protein